jgi:hypothetical protein
MTTREHWTAATAADVVLSANNKNQIKIPLTLNTGGFPAPDRGLFSAAERECGVPELGHPNLGAQRYVQYSTVSLQNINYYSLNCTIIISVLPVL